VKKVLLFSFHDIDTKPKMHHCVTQLKDHQIVESGKLKSKKSKKFTRKSVGFNFAAFLGFLGLIPVTYKSNGMSTEHVSVPNEKN